MSEETDQPLDLEAIDPYDKEKIIDLWRSKRANRKNRLRLNLWKKLGLLILALALNIGLVALVHFATLPPFAVKIHGNNLSPYTYRYLQEWLAQKTLTFSPVFFSIPRVKREILLEHPLLVKLELKVVLSLADSYLWVYAEEDFSWARFLNGWLLTSRGNLMKDTRSLNFDRLSLASQTLLIADDDDYSFWAKCSKDLQRLITSVNQQLPEIPLKGIDLRDRQDIILYFPHFQVHLGTWDRELLSKRASRLFSVYAAAQEQPYPIEQIDLSSNIRATITTSGGPGPAESLPQTIETTDQPEPVLNRFKLSIYVQPNAKANEVLGYQDDLLRIRLKAPATEGKANRELIAYLAELCRVPREQVQIRQGANSRRKLVEIQSEEKVLPSILQGSARLSVDSSQPPPNKP